MEQVIIGNQIWDKQNLQVDRFRNGDIIFNAKNKQEWLDACRQEQPAWCFYKNAGFNGQKYGIIYNWYAVNDSRGLAPEGWSIPTNEDWNKLIDFLGGENNGGKILKAKSG